MRRSTSSVITRWAPIIEGYQSPPIEVGWASEAVFYVQARGSAGHLLMRLQMSGDGYNWADCAEHAEVESPGIDPAIIRASNFGNWIRVVARDVEAEGVEVLIHLALKE